MTNENAETKGNNKVDGEDDEKKKAKAERMIGGWLVAAIFVLIAIGAAVYLIHGSSVLVKTVLYVGVSGGIGGVFYCMNGFITHIAQDDFDAKWNWWYLFHPIIGFILGIAVYFLIVGGLLTLGSVTQPNYSKGLLLYCAISFVAGFSTKKVIEKLNEIASNTFSTSTTASGPAVSYEVSGFPNPVTAGTSGSIKVKAKDANGNVADSYSGTVHFTSTDPQPTLPSDYTFQANDKGIHTFQGIILNTPGTQSITATDTTNGSIKGSQEKITVNASGK
jgi:hypothetical protein